MAGKKRTPNNQLRFRGEQIPTYDELTGEMINETTSILTDYVRQYITAYNNGVSSGIFINQDPVLRQQTYQQWAQYDLYNYLEQQDTHIGAILSAARVNIAGMRWSVKPYLRGKEKKPSVTNQAQADFVENALNSIDDFQQALYNLTDALGKGFSFSEIIWEQREGNYWTISELLNRTQRRIQFDATTRQPRIRTLENPFFGDPIPAGKYIVHRFSSTWENPFGDALDKSLYWMWLFKKMAFQFYLKHLEVGASSVPIIQHPANANQQLKKEALDIASQIRNGAYGRLPANFSILWAEAKNAAISGEAFEKFIRMCNDEMTKLVKGQLLTTEGASSTGAGSRALGQTHLIIEDQYDIFRAKALANSVNKYLVKFLIDYNFASVEGYPKFSFDVDEEEDLKNASDVLVNLTKALPNYDIDISEISDKFGYTFTQKQTAAQKPQQIQTIQEGVTQ